MIDGIKIDVHSLNGSKWLSNKLLQFHTYTNVKTGEILDGTIVAKCQGLKFFITQSSKYENVVYYTVRGSLHKYFNKGKHNANDFTFFDFQNVVKDLHQKFNINPETAVLRNIEFGVNITTPVPTKELLKNLVCYGNYLFGTLRIDKVVVGKSIIQQRSDLKIYDKGKQYDLPVQNLTRIEIAVKKMVFLKKYNIVRLSDLQDKSKIEPLGKLLLSYWNDVIYYDKAINWKQLTEFERKKTLYYATPRNWSDFEIKQRYRAKKHFKELMQKFSTSTTHKEIYNLIAQKWSDLTAVMCPQINHDLNPENKNQNVHKLTIRIHGYSMDISTSKKSIKILAENDQKKTTKNKIIKNSCKSCKKDISQKRANTKFCSKKCNNNFHGQKRTKRNQQKRTTENLNLDRCIKILAKNKLWLLVTYKNETGSYSDYLHQSEINTTLYWIKSITNLRIDKYRKNAKPIFLTSLRAKKLIRLINHKNKMAYNKINYYKRIIEIQEITKEHQGLGLNNTEIFKRNIAPRFMICKRTFDEYLGIPAKRELKKLTENFNDENN